MTDLELRLIGSMTKGLRLAEIIFRSGDRQQRQMDMLCTAELRRRVCRVLKTMRVFRLINDEPFNRTIIRDTPIEFVLLLDKKIESRHGTRKVQESYTNREAYETLQKRNKELRLALQCMKQLWSK